MTCECEAAYKEQGALETVSGNRPLASHREPNVTGTGINPLMKRIELATREWMISTNCLKTTGLSSRKNAFVIVIRGFHGVPQIPPSVGFERDCVTAKSWDRTA